VTSVAGTAQWPTGDSYSQWIRRALSSAGSSGGKLFPLFDSSTQEPVDLLTDLVARTFGERPVPAYLSTFANGNPLVVEALAQRYGVTPAQVLTTPGATSALSLLYRTFLKPGDHVLIETPGFDLFGDLAQSFYAKVDTFSRAPGTATIDPAEIEAKLRPETRLVVLSDLHNPTSQPLCRETLAQIAKITEARGIELIVDEVYREFAADPATSAVHLGPNVIVVNSLTKVFGLSSLRCGWIIVDPSRLERVRIAHSRVEFGTSKLSHAVAAAVLRDPAPFDAHWRSVLEQTRPVIARHFVRLRDAGLLQGTIPDHGCICFPKLVGVDDSLAFSDWLAATYGVAVAPGEYFSAPGHVRIGFSRDAAALDTALGLFGEGLARWTRREVGAVA